MDILYGIYQQGNNGRYSRIPNSFGMIVDHRHEIPDIERGYLNRKYLLRKDKTEVLKKHWTSYRGYVDNADRLDYLTKFRLEFVR